MKKQPIKFTKEMLIEELQRISKVIGRNSVSVKELEKYGRISQTPFRDRFGKWSIAVAAAGLESAYKRGSSDFYVREKLRPELALKIMKRDSFKCGLCGAAPSNDRSVILHVDHIFPVVRGGETKESNLWTLCSACNHKKGCKIDKLIIVTARQHLINCKFWEFHLEQCRR